MTILKNNWPTVYSFFVLYYQNGCKEKYSKICLIKDVKWKEEVIYLETPNIDYSATPSSASSASNPERKIRKWKSGHKKGGNKKWSQKQISK